MTRIVHCRFYDQDLPGLDTPPYHGSLGQKIHDSISKQAWDQWLEHQTKLINEYHLSTIDPESIQFIENQMIAFLFEKKTELPPKFKPQETKE
ncbi:MAG TPA: oxidative damage protection protein [Gammaproteobacteria bacterium]|nr:oxidative damage protection protein [Gammaproteobacteria bacterium]